MVSREFLPGHHDTTCMNLHTHTHTSRMVKSTRKKDSRYLHTVCQYALGGDVSGTVTATSMSVTDTVISASRPRQRVFQSYTSFPLSVPRHTMQTPSHVAKNRRIFRAHVFSSSLAAAMATVSL